MPAKLLLVTVLLLGGMLWFQSDGKQGVTLVRKYNRLGESKSPYLLQHKDNPVWWYPWGEEAFAAARAENKLIFLSIGYSTCYWCHMMEKDSFELQEVADALNNNYISIKVDREEHPDVDQIYMDAVVAMTGQGGWPMSLVLTPDLKPVFGGTFFWRAQFISLLTQIQQLWRQQPEKVLESGKKITEHLQTPPSSILPHQRSHKERGDWLDKAFLGLQNNFDATYGGFGAAPKFPQSTQISFLLREYHRTGNQKALAMATKTLDAMALGGIFDHLGGGFHRYSTDEQWLIPHFEKMLYDNALLAWTYLEAYQVTKKEMYRDVAAATLDYVLREMTHPEGGFYSAQDAGEVEKEGEFYVWEYPELASFPELAALYQTSPTGNFEGNNILHLALATDWAKTQTPMIQQQKKQLLQIRSRRTPPHKDDKILTSWNGLMIAAQAKGYQVLGDKRYLETAERAARFIEEHLSKDGILLRRWRDGDGRFAGTLEDYSFLIYGLTYLYESDFNEAWLVFAKELQAKQDALFWDSTAGGYFMTEANDPHILVRKKEFHDGALPSGNSISLLNLQRLFGFFYEEGVREKIEKLSQWTQGLIPLLYQQGNPKEIAVIGKPESPTFQEARLFFHQTFLPHKTLGMGKGTIPLLDQKTMLDGKTTFYLCENNTCNAPTTDFKKVQEILWKR